MADGLYGDLSGAEAISDASSRKLEKVLSSLSYRLGKIIVDSARKPWMLPLIPFSIGKLLVSFSLESLGKRKYILHNSSTFENNKQRDCIVLFPTNGVGLGHFSRMFSLARAIKRARPSTEIVFFTTSPVVHPIYSRSFTCYHLPGRKKFTDMSPSSWNSICEESLANVISLHRPRIFVFDGSYPYRGMLNSIKNKTNIHKVWIRRPGKLSSNSIPTDSISHFDRIVIPGDYIETDEEIFSSWDVEEVNLVPPLISVSRSDLLPSRELKGRLGIPNESQVALISLGAGVINEIGDVRRFVIEGITSRGIYAVIADSMLNPSDEFFDDTLVRVVKEFPIMKYRKSFDFAIIAGGYNSIHESIFLKLPSLVIPNDGTGSDDQRLRSNFAAQSGGFIVIDEGDYEMMDLAIERMCDESVRNQMIESLIENERIVDGSPFLADALFN